MKTPVIQYRNFRDNCLYDTCYIAVDLHNTVFVPTFDTEETFTYFRWAKQCLQMLSKMPFVKLIMWTSCYQDKIEMYLKHFEENNIHFDYVNENPECSNSNYACFDNKFYFDIGLDDRFGFEPEKDWAELYPELIKYFV